ncbi:MAG TPA: host attachment protein [Chthoniobacterales bacterium]
MIATRDPRMTQVNFVFVADRGQLKTYLLDRNHSPNLRLVNALDLVESRRPVSAEFTAPAGRFPNNGTGGQGNSSAERGGVGRERQARATRTVARQIAEVLGQIRPRAWYLAAPSEIYAELLSHVPMEFQASLAGKIEKDLVNSPPEQILQYVHPT